MESILAGSPRTLAALLEILLGSESVIQRDTSAPSISQLRIRYGIDAYTDPAEALPLLTSMARDDLFGSAMRDTLNTNLAFECFLQKLRRFLLLKYHAEGWIPEGLEPLVEPLAQQGFNNEYIMNEDEDERRALRAIEEYLQRTFAADCVGKCEVAMLLLGMYRPLGGYPFAKQIAALPIDVFSAAMRPALKRMIYEPLDEERLALEIPSFSELTCSTSKAVRAQYEENPYPRWFKLDRSPIRSLEEVLTQLSPGFAWPASFPSKKLDILVPGCGTGWQPLRVASGMPEARILALDLSKRSMAYAKRMAEKLGIHNVEFLHGDLLDIPRMERRFHHIDCFGVLHHLRDPMAGWRALNAALLPGGTLGIGVYSKAARMHVQFLHGEIKKLGIPPIAQPMKAFRSLLIADDRYRPFLKSLSRLEDFYYLSGFRDYLFHASEYRYDIRELQEIAGHFNFRFLGFNPRMLKNQYLALFPDDPGMNSFENWRKFELHYACSGILLSFFLQKAY